MTIKCTSKLIAYRAAKHEAGVNELKFTQREKFQMFMITANCTERREGSTYRHNNDFTQHLFLCITDIQNAAEAGLHRHKASCIKLAPELLSLLQFVIRRISSLLSQ